MENKNIFLEKNGNARKYILVVIASICKNGLTKIFFGQVWAKSRPSFLIIKKMESKKSVPFLGNKNEKPKSQ